MFAHMLNRPLTFFFFNCQLVKCLLAEGWLWTLATIQLLLSRPVPREAGLGLWPCTMLGWNDGGSGHYLHQSQ